MLLKMRDGKTTSDAYKEYYIAALIGSRKWRRDLINHWTTTLGSPLTTINGKQYWGGAYDLNHLNESPDMVKMADYFGISQAGKDDIYAAGVSGDTDYVYAYFRPKPKSENPYSIDNVAYMFEHGIAPKAVESGLSSIIFKSIDIVVPCVYTNGVLDDPMLHAPAALPMKSVLRTSSSYHSNFSIINTTIDSYTVLGIANYNALGISKLGDVFSSIYSICDFFEQFCSNAITVEYAKTNYGLLDTPVSWVFRTHHTFTMGDYAWITDNNVRGFLYPAIVIGTSIDTDYFNFTTINQMRGGTSVTITGKNLSGKIMDVIDRATTGNGTLETLQLFNPYMNPYAWSIVVDGKLWVEYDHIMAMEIKEFMQFINLHLDITAGASSGGFFGTFVGGFVGFFIEVFGKLIDLFFRIVEMTDIIMGPTIRAILTALDKLGIITEHDAHNFYESYRIVRNYVALAAVTMGVGNYIQAASISAEASGAMVASGGVALTAAETSMIFANLMEISIANIGIGQVLGLATQLYTAWGADDYGVAPAAAEAVTEAVKNPFGVVYESSDVDFIDAIYMQMDDIYGDFAPDVLSLVYS